MNNRIDFDDLDRYLSGEASAEERERLDARAAADPRVREMLTAARGEQLEWDTDRAWSNLRGRMQASARGPARWRTPTIAAAAVLLVALGSLFTQHAHLPFSSRHVGQAEYSTRAGERKSVTLPDRSTVELAPASRLSVSEEFGRGERTVTLDGEAFFQVSHDAGHPFVVRSALAETRVLGTTFDVSAYAGSPTNVALASGRVRVRGVSAQDTAVLAPGQVAQVEQSGVTVRTLDVADLTAWRQGRLLFRDASFASVAAALERWYDVDLVIADSALARTHVTALFQQQPLDDVLQALSETLGARYERSDSRVTFYSK